MDESLIKKHWPKLNSENWHTISPRDGTYNCFAFAAHVQNNWWDPVSSRWYWPPGSPRGSQLENVKAAWVTMGYEVCENGILEEGFEKVAFYIRDGKTKHAARQASNGKWVSKLGSLEDIEHDTLEDLEGPMYGRVAAYVRKRIS